MNSCHPEIFTVVLFIHYIQLHNCLQNKNLAIAVHALVFSQTEYNLVILVELISVGAGCHFKKCIFSICVPA